MKTIIFYGLRRSGNHFVISTLLQQFNNAVHINDTKLSFDNYIKYSRIPMTCQRSDVSYTGFKNTECVILSMENKPVDMLELNKFNNIPDTHVVILIRNPYNTMASAWKIYMLRDKPTPGKVNDIIKLWPVYAQLFLDNNTFVKIIYDKYCESPEYIDSCLHKMKILKRGIDINKNIKWQCSSFKDEGNCRKTWGTFEDNIFYNLHEYRQLFTETQIHKLWSNIIRDETTHVITGN